MNKQTKTIPKFSSEADERKFWETHDSSVHLDWTKAKKVVLPNLKPSTRTVSLRQWVICGTTTQQVLQFGISIPNL